MFFNNVLLFIEDNYLFIIVGLVGISSLVCIILYHFIKTCKDNKSLLNTILDNKIYALDDRHIFMFTKAEYSMYIINITIIEPEYRTEYKFNCIEVRNNMLKLYLVQIAHGNPPKSNELIIVKISNEKIKLYITREEILELYHYKRKYCLF